MGKNGRAVTKKCKKKVIVKEEEEEEKKSKVKDFYGKYWENHLLLIELEYKTRMILLCSLFGFIGHKNIISVKK